VLKGDPAGLEACIGKCAGHQEELRALLRVAAALKQVPEEAVPRDGFLDDLRSRLMEKTTTNSTRGGETE